MTALDKPSRPPVHPEALHSEGQASYAKIDLGAFEEDDTTLSVSNTTGDSPTMKVVIKPSRLGKLSPIVEELGRSESSDTAWRSGEQSRTERASPFLGSESTLEPIEEAREDERTTEAGSLEKERSVTLKFSNRLEKSEKPSTKQDGPQEGGHSSSSFSSHSSVRHDSAPFAGGLMFQKAALKLKEKRRSSQHVGDSVDPVFEPTTVNSSPVLIGARNNDVDTDSSDFPEKSPFDEPKPVEEESKNVNDVRPNGQPTAKTVSSSIRPENPRRNVWNQSFWPQDGSDAIHALLPKAVDPDGLLKRAMSPPLLDSPFENQTTLGPEKGSEDFVSPTLKTTSTNNEGEETEKTCYGKNSIKISGTVITEHERQQRIAALRAQRAKRKHHDASPVPSDGSASSNVTLSDTILSKDTDSRASVKLFSVDPPSSSEVEDPRMARLLALRAKRQSMLSSHNFFQQTGGITGRKANLSNDSKESNPPQDQDIIEETNLGNTVPQVATTEPKMNAETVTSAEVLCAKRWHSSSQSVLTDDELQLTQNEKKEDTEPAKVSESPIQHVQDIDRELPLADHVDTFHQSNAGGSPRTVQDSSLPVTEMKSEQVVDVETKTDDYGTDASGTMQVIDIISVGTSDCTLASAEQDPIIIVESDGDSEPYLVRPKKASVDCAASRVICITPSLENMKESDMLSVARSNQGYHAKHLTIDLVSFVGVDGKEDPGGAHLRYQADPPSLSDMEEKVQTNNKQKDPEHEGSPSICGEVDTADTKGSVVPGHALQDLASEPSKATIRHNNAQESSKNDLEVQSIIDLIRMEDELEDRRLLQDRPVSLETKDCSPKAGPSILPEPMSPVIAESQTPEVHDSPFENVRRRLVQLNIEDFRTVVMGDVKAHKDDLDKQLSEMVNDDDVMQKVNRRLTHENTKEEASHPAVGKARDSSSNERKVPYTTRELGVLIGTENAENSRVSVPESLCSKRPKPVMMNERETELPGEEDEADAREKKKTQNSTKRITNDPLEETILDELADLESVSDPIPKPNLSSTVESILDTTEKSGQRSTPRIDNAMDSLVAKTDDDSSFRSGKRPPNMHVRFGDSSEFGLKSDLTESYMDLHMQDDATNASTKSIETMDSDLDTLYESSTVPLLVRMLDRGCAWLEDSQACGADSKPTLFRETRVPPVDKRLVSSKKRLALKQKASTKTKETSLPPNLPKSAPRSSKNSNTAKNDAVLKAQRGEDKAARNSGHLPTHLKSMKKARKGPRSRKKAKNLFAFPLFKSGVNGEYKLSSGFFNKASDNSSLETSTDSSSYENPICVDGTVETSSESQNGERFRFQKYKALKARQKHVTRSTKKNSGDTRTKTPITNVQKGPPSPERGRFVSEKRSFQFPSTTTSERTDQSVIDVTDMTLEKAAMTLSPRMQGLPPTPTGSNISRAFQDKLQQRLTRVRDASSMLTDDNSTESNDNRQIHGQRRDPVEEIRRDVEIREGQDPPEAQEWQRKMVVSPRRNEKHSKSNDSEQSPPHHPAGSTIMDDPIESDRLAALALAEKLRLRASELKEKRRKSNDSIAKASAQLNKAQSSQIKV